MMSAVQAEEETVSISRAEPPPSAAAADAGPGATTPVKPAGAKPPPPAAAPASPEIPLPPVIDGIDGTTRKPDKWNASVTSLKGWISEAVQLTKETAQTAQRAMAGVGVRRDSRPRFLCVGDSLTEQADALLPAEGGPGWCALLRARYGPRGEVLTRGFSGYNSRYALSVLPPELHSVDLAHVRAVLLWFGANDAAAAGTPQHVPLEEYRYHLTKLAQYVGSLRNASGRIVPVLVTPPALCDEMRYRDTNGDPKRSAARTKEYADACVEVACQLSFPFVDVHSAMLAEVDGDGSEKGVGRFLTDGLHFSTAGNALVERLVVEVLESHFKEYAPSNAPLPFPEWERIDPDNHEKLLGPCLQM